MLWPKFPVPSELRDRSAWKKNPKIYRSSEREPSGIVPSMRLEQWRNTLLYAYQACHGGIYESHEALTPAMPRRDNRAN